MSPQKGIAGAENLVSRRFREMSDDKPMTVKERMAALARASSGGNSGMYFLFVYLFYEF